MEPATAGDDAPGLAVAEAVLKEWSGNLSSEELGLKQEDLVSIPRQRSFILVLFYYVVFENKIITSPFSFLSFPPFFRSRLVS